MNMYPVYVTIVGSKLYNVSTDTSDTDIKGFCFPEPDYIIGLKHFEQQEFKNEVPDGPDKIEGVLYDVRRYIELCVKGNPTVLEISHSSDNFHIVNTDIGKEICKFVRENMIVKNIFRPYSAYLQAQIKKMENMKPVGKRKELVDKFSFDTKFCSQAVRLAIQGYQLMQNKGFNPTLSPEYATLCKDIRAGKYSKEETVSIIKEYDTKMYEAYKISTLPDTVDFNKVNQWITKLYSEWIAYCYDSNNFSEKFKDVKNSINTSDIMKALKPVVKTDS